MQSPHWHDIRVIETRVATPDDWQQWRELRRRALAEAPEAFGSVLADWSGPTDTRERWRNRLASVPLILVLFSEGQAAGIVSAAAPNDRDCVALISMWIELRVKTDNARAIRLYERHGFVDEGTAPDAPEERRMRLGPK